MTGPQVVLPDAGISSANGISRRVPACQVAFMGEHIIRVQENQLISVTTQKALGEPAGMFEITLLAADDFSLFNSYRAGRNVTPDKSDVTGAYWFDVLRPMMLTQIIFSAGPVKSWGFVTPDGGTSTSNVGTEALSGPLEQITMLGLIDEVSLEKQMTPNGPRRFVRITGRDMGRAFTDDIHYCFPFPTLNSDGQSAPYIYYMGNDKDRINTTVERYFVLSSTDEDGKKVDSWRSELANGNKVGDLVQSIYKNASGLDLVLSNGKNLRQYLADPQVASDITDITFFGADLLQSSGTVWSLLKYLAPSPFCEMFVDTVDRRARLIIRRPPFLRPYSDVNAELEKIIDSTKENPSDPVADRALFSTDDVTTTPYRLYKSTDTGLPYHVVYDNAILGMTLGRTDRETVNLYWSKSPKINQGIIDPVQSASTNPPMLDTASVRKYGLRMYNSDNPWYLLNNNPLHKLHLDTFRLYLYFRDNAEYISGNVIIAGRSDIRIGDYVFLPEYDTIFYVEGVSNHWSFGGVYTTQLQVTRGQTLAVPERK